MIAGEDFRPAKSDDHLFHFPGNALGRQHPQQFFLMKERGTCVRMDCKSQGGSEPQRPENPQRIFVKPLHRIANAGNDFVFQVLLAIEIIPQSEIRMPAQRVDRKIPPRAVFL